MSADIDDALISQDELSSLFASIRRPVENAAASRQGVAAGAPSTKTSDVVALAATQDVLARPVRMRSARLARDLRTAGPILLRAEDDQYLLLLRVVRGQAHCLHAQGRLVRLPLRRLTKALQDGQDHPLAQGQQAPLDQLPPTVAALLAQDRARYGAVCRGWLLERVSVHGGTPDRLVDLHTLTGAAGVLVCHLAQFFFWICSWIVLSQMIFATGLTTSWTSVWGLCLAATVALSAGARWTSNALALDLGTRIKQRILQALLSLTSDQARIAGLGRMIATTLDASRLDLLAINGGTATALALAETAVLLAVVVAMGSWPLVLLLLLSLVALAATAWRYYQQHQRWHRSSLAVTALHAEEMVGHRARKMLLGMDDWFHAEGEELARYNAASRAADQVFLLLKIAPRVWLLFGAAAVLLSAYLAEGFSTPSLITNIGVLLLGTSALKRIAQGGREVVDAAISYRHLAHTFQLQGAESTNRPQRTADPFASSKAPALVVSELAFRYPGAAQAPISDLDLELHPADRMTLQGASGAGKSTLARILTGRLAPTHGSIMLGGLDPQVLGLDAWRRQVRYVPQYHNNHVLTETLMFNLLLGCGWPPNPQVLARLERVVDAVGLRPLVERMPAGLQQMVGEGGWRMSQGERARLFLARGLLQHGRLLILDEPLGALDPESALGIMDALQELDCMLIMITHR